MCSADVRFWHKADIAKASEARLLLAQSGREPAARDALHSRGLPMW